MLMSMTIMMMMMMIIIIICMICYFIVCNLHCTHDRGGGLFRVDKQCYLFRISPASFHANTKVSIVAYCDPELPSTILSLLSQSETGMHGFPKDICTCQGAWLVSVRLFHLW